MRGVVQVDLVAKFPNECNGLGYLKLPETDAQSDDPTGGILYGFCKHCNGKGCVEI
jgi:hypothetical protein